VIDAPPDFLQNIHRTYSTVSEHIYDESPDPATKRRKGFDQLQSEWWRYKYRQDSEKQEYVGHFIYLGLQAQESTGWSATS
jgi:hypothetical protein